MFWIQLCTITPVQEHVNGSLEARSCIFNQDPLYNFYQRFRTNVIDRIDQATISVYLITHVE